MRGHSSDLWMMGELNYLYGYHWPTNDELPEWVKEMHEFKAKHGYFRASDIYRVLGDPRKSVSMSHEQ